MNSLYNQLGNNDFMQRFNQFRASFRGDPQQQIQQMLQSGRITQAQLNDAQSKAMQIMKMLGK